MRKLRSTLVDHLVVGKAAEGVELEGNNSNEDGDEDDDEDEFDNEERENGGGKEGVGSMEGGSGVPAVSAAVALGTSSGTGSRLLALSRISFSAGQGQLVAIVGQVGAGKSSLLSAILGTYLLYVTARLSFY